MHCEILSTLAPCADSAESRGMMTKSLVFTEYGGPEKQAFADRPTPAPEPGEIAIAVKAAGVNPADWKIREGQLGKHWKLPAPMGREASGIVIAVGPGVEGFAVGDAVLGLAAKGHGTFAEHTVLHAKQTALKPEQLSFADAAALPVAGSTAYDVTHQIELEAGQTMLILGAGGGVGLIAAQLGKMLGLTVIGVASAAKKQLVESTGARFVRSGDGAADRVRALVPEGVDLIIDLVGGQPLRDIAPAAKRSAAIVSTADPATAVKLGGAGVVRTSAGLEYITDAAQNGFVNPYVTDRFNLEQAMEALAHVETGHTAGKVIIEP